MKDNEWLLGRFEANRPHLQAVAYRMLGSLSEADDAVQDAWLRLSRADISAVENLDRWLTTVVARLCLDMLRARKARREEPLGDAETEPLAGRAATLEPEPEAVLADSVGLALLVVLETLTPAERLAFVLHDMFAVPFNEIAPMLGRSPAAARQLASRARRRVQGTASLPEREVSRQRPVVEAFLAAARGGDFEALLAVLDPEVVVRADSVAAPAGTPREVRGARVVAGQALAFSRRARFSQMALVNGAVGIVVAPRGRLFEVMCFKVERGRVVEIELIADPIRLRQLDLAALDELGPNNPAAQT